LEAVSHARCDDTRIPSPEKRAPTLWRSFLFLARKRRPGKGGALENTWTLICTPPNGTVEKPFRFIMYGACSGCNLTSAGEVIEMSEKAWQFTSRVSFRCFVVHDGYEPHFLQAKLETCGGVKGQRELMAVLQSSGLAPSSSPASQGPVVSTSPATPAVPQQQQQQQQFRNSNSNNSRLS
jgi:hypothetical protein